MNAPENNIFIIFGGTGDLTKRKIIPALYKNYKQGLLSENFGIVGLGRNFFSDKSYQENFREWINDNEIDQIDKFLQHIYYKQLDVNNLDDFNNLSNYLSILDNKLKTNNNYLFYLAVGPVFFESIVTNLGLVGLTNKNSIQNWKRIIIEKPFGNDLESAKSLNKTLLKYFQEEDIFRIDHYLGKETVQNILAFRFANEIFEPLWNRNYIDYIEITGCENLGVGSRANYYDQTGALRDMVQNHLLQLVSIIAMEPPNSFEAKTIRDEKMKIFSTLSPIKKNNIEKNVIRGQYIESKINGNKISGYRNEDKVNLSSKTETFVALKVMIDNWRWSGVPFYIRTGKRMPARVSEVVINFKKSPSHLFKNMNVQKNEANKLILRIQPDEGIVINFGMKKPGEGFDINNVSMDFHYSDLSSKPLPEAYERLLLDALNGDPALYARNDAVEACWNYISPILNAWTENPEIGLYGYPAGTWGPKEADKLFENSQHKWHNPCPNLTKNGEHCEL